MDKSSLRLHIRTLLSQLDPAYREKAAERLASILSTQLAAIGPCHIAAYIPLPHEISPLPSLFALSRHNASLRYALPAMLHREAPLLFTPWHPGKPLGRSAYGFYQPPCLYPTCVPDILLIPLLAVDPKGYRLGQGLGMYDRTLAALKHLHPTLKAIGIGFACQQLDTIPTEPHDVPLDAFASEDGWVEYDVPSNF